ncbi:MAG: anthrone oxygenase family protein [Chitinophagaceae bacterium]
MSSIYRKMIMANIILLITTTSTGLIAGLLYSYSCSVNLGLGRLTDTEYVSAMQSINRAIQNPLFFFSFMGTLILLPISTYMHYGQPSSNRFIILLIATAIYIVAVFGITMFGNVPLNNALDLFNVKSASVEEIASQRAKFEISWNRLHTVRTIASVIAFVLVVYACLKEPVI